MTSVPPNRTEFHQATDHFVADIDRLVADAGSFDGDGVSDWLGELEDHLVPTAAVLGAMLALAPGPRPGPALDDDELIEFAELLAENWAGGTDVYETFGQDTLAATRLVEPTDVEPTGVEHFVASDSPYDWADEEELSEDIFGLRCFADLDLTDVHNSEVSDVDTLRAASAPPFEIWPELLLSILRDSTGPMVGWRPDDLVTARRWSLHAAVIVGFLSADWLVTDRWRLLCEAVASVSVDTTGHPSFDRHTRGHPDD